MPSYQKECYISQDGLEAFKHAKIAVNNLANAIIEAACALANTMKKFLERFKRFISLVVEIYQQKLINAPPRIKHLALYAKKARIRKKNIARLWSYD